MLVKMSEPAANDDLELLRQFTRDHSQAAFTALVQRHVNLVYSAALRQVRSPQLAEDVTQSTFADLARNAAKLTNAREAAPVLAAWLYQVARHTAVDVIRKESRRQLREQIAVEMNAMNTDALSRQSEAAAGSWTEIEPLLDEAVATLDETDRAAVLLRYFENQSLRAVGQQLGVSDDAAQKRVSRAVERLREFFAKRGVSVGAGGLVVVISANAVQAAPVGLAITISAAALAGTAATTSTLIAATTKTIAMTTLQKTLVTATVAVLAGAGIYEARQAAQLRDQVQTLQQQQAPLAEQIQQTKTEQAGMTNATIAFAVEESRQSGLRPHESVKPLEPSRVLRPATLINNQTGQQSNDGNPTLPLQTPTEPFANPTNHFPEVLTYAEALREIAVKRFADATNALANATSDSDRYLYLSEAAKFAFLFGKTEDARNYATELLALDQRFLAEPWRGGDAVFYGNLVLGRIAVQEGRINEAKQYLLESGHTIGSPVLGSFGPDMTLAKDLLQHGERDTVIQFFELCEKFWKSDSLQNWKKTVQSAATPDFGGNLY